MNIRALALPALLLAGCPGGAEPLLPPEIDLSSAQQFENDGRKVDAVIEYARLLAEVDASGRTDARAQAGRARILYTLHRMNLAEILANMPEEMKSRCTNLVPWAAGPGLLSAGAAGQWNLVLTMGPDPAVLAEAAGALSDLLAEKLESRPLRRGRIEPEGEISERLYRRCLAKAASEYALYAVGRTIPRTREVTTRAIDRLRKLGQEMRELSAFPGVREGPSARWAEQAVQADTAALALRRDRAGENDPVSNDLRQLVEMDSNGLLRSANELNNKANDLLSRRASEEEILDALERALRNFVAGRECLVEPTAQQRKTLALMTISADALRGLAFEN